MSAIDQLLIAARQQGITLWLDDQQLRFKAKPGALTPDWQARLKERKPEILAFLREARAEDTALPNWTAQPAGRNAPFPLTDIQEAYWLGRGQQFELHTPSHYYEEFAVFDADPDRLEQAWHRLVERHDMLRAIILPSAAQQVLAEVDPRPLPRHDLRAASPEAIERHLDALRRELFLTPFPPHQWPLFNVQLTWLPEGEIRVHFSVDMLIVDWGSYKILVREWGLLHADPDRVLPPVDLAFRDYVLTERKLKALPTYRNAERYWRERLTALPPAPELPLAMDPALLEPAEFRRRNGEVDAPRWARLKALATTSGMTPTGLLLTAFAEVLARWSKQPRFTINLTLFNRMPFADPAQIGRIVGDFTSLTLLAIDHQAATESLAERGQRLQQQLWRDLEHRAFSGVQVLRAMAAAGAPARMPIVFTSGLGIADDESSGFGEGVHGFSQTPQVFLDCQVEESQGRLMIVWDAVEALFPAGMLDAMFGVFLDLLDRLARDQATWHAASLDLLPPDQRQQRQAVNLTEAPIRQDLLHTLFVEQARKHPERVAVIAPNRTLDYATLLREAAQVGGWLRERGAQPNQLVPVVMEKGWEQVVAVLGVLLSGAAYVPIDPELPAERRAHLLERSEAKLALYQGYLADRLTWPEGLQTLAVDEAALAAMADWEPGTPLQTLTDLAYVIYTSGSTGQPKGVVIDHRGAVNTIVDINQRFGITAEDRVLALSALNFDLSVYDIFGLLAIGGALVLPRPDGRRDPSHWVDLMTRHQVTTWNTVPALMHMLVEYQSGQPLDVPLRVTLMSGDWIPLDLPDRIRATFANAEPISLGGATEASIWSIFYPIGAVDPGWKSIPYGKPLANQTFQVFNARLEPCPTWVPGQLCISGIGLALGYWRDEAKTHAQFFTHPRTGDRWYNTGDLGRYLPDGNIEFLGREDFQVKIRGYRIELGEIESHLLKHPQVQTCVVSVVGESRNDQQLAAYYIPEPEPRSVDDSAVDQAAHARQSMQGVLSDPMERLQFRLDQPGIRRFESPPPATPLPAADIPDRTYLSRQSFREFIDDPVTAAQLGQWLTALRPRNFEGGALPKYRYGSAGSLYPIQTYLYLKPGRIAGLEGGFYYYHPLEHQLFQLSPDTSVSRQRYDGINQVIYDQAAFILFLVAEYRAIEPMYGDSARDFCLLEAGYISQLLMMECARHGLGLCPIGGMDFAPLSDFLGLGESQEMVHSFLGGGIAVEQTQRLTQVAPQAEPLEERLRNDLGGKLPGYMVPAFFIPLETLPLTANGKIDRKALPAPECRQVADAAEDPPSNERERWLLDLAREVLGVPSLGPGDNFAHQGADSLAMVRLYNAAREASQREFTIAEVFEHSSVRALARIIAQAPAIDTAPATTGDRETEALTPEEIDRLDANLDHLSEAEIERLLNQLS